jgi:hypothetical protein
MEYSTGFILTSESSLESQAEVYSGSARIILFKVKMISQGIEAKLDGQERNNSIYRLKFPNGG